jgi:hypothetical protein
LVENKRLLADRARPESSLNSNLFETTLSVGANLLRKFNGLTPKNVSPIWDNHDRRPFKSGVEQQLEVFERELIGCVNAAGWLWETSVLIKGSSVSMVSRHNQSQVGALQGEHPMKTSSNSCPVPVHCRFCVRNLLRQFDRPDLPDLPKVQHVLVWGSVILYYIWTKAVIDSERVSSSSIPVYSLTVLLYSGLSLFRTSYILCKRRTPGGESSSRIRRRREDHTMFVMYDGRTFASATTRTLRSAHANG